MTASTSLLLRFREDEMDSYSEGVIVSSLAGNESV